MEVKAYNENSVVVNFAGDARIDLSSLTYTLEGMKGLIDYVYANSKKGKSQELRVDVKPFKDGSFEFFLEFADGALQALNQTELLVGASSLTSFIKI